MLYTRRVLALLMASYLLVEARPVRAAAKVGGEFQVNAVTAGSQRQPHAAVDGDGDFVVVWTSEGQDGSANGVFARRFTSSGAAAGGESRSTRTPKASSSTPRSA